MVLFENINVNQRVEVLRDGQIYSGTVKYKGSINGISGEWVGVELELPEGQHDGRVKARRYFQCRPGHGIFTTASQIRFIPIRRCLRNTYRTVEKWSEVDDELFDSEFVAAESLSSSLSSRSESCVELRCRQRSSTNFDQRDDIYQARRYPLCHSVSNHVPPATTTRPDRAKSRCFSPRRPSPFHSPGGSTEDEDFVSAPSIPAPHVPHSALRRQVRRHGPEQTHYPRLMSVNYGRDAIKLAQWNDISA